MIDYYYYYYYYYYLKWAGHTHRMELLESPCECGMKLNIIIIIIIILKNKSVAYSSEGSHTGQLDFCNRLPDGSTTG